MVTGPEGPISAGFVSPGWPPDSIPNGIIPYVANMATGMRRAGHRATVLALQSTAGPDSDEVLDLGPEAGPSGLAERAVDSLVRRFSMLRFLQRRSGRAIVAGCRRLIAGPGLQVIEMEESFGIAGGVQRALPIPVVLRIHGPWFLNGPLQGGDRDPADSRARIRAEGRTIRDAFWVIAPSVDVLEQTRAHYGLALPRAEVIPNPTAMVPPEERWGAEGSDPSLILFIGRFDRHKGGDLVIDAFAEVARRLPEARLRFIGPDRDFVDDAGRPWTIEEYLADRLGDRRGRADWVGRQPASELNGHRKRAGVVVIASRYDNFPNTVLEAAAAGCPIVAARTGGIPEIVQDGVNGLLFEPGDPADLAAKLLRLLGDRTLAAGLAAQALADAERRYSPAAVVRETADSYRRAIEAWAGPRGRGASR